MVVSVTVDQEGLVRLSQASMRTGMFALPVRVKANRPELKRGWDVELTAWFQHAISVRHWRSIVNRGIDKFSNF